MKTFVVMLALLSGCATPTNGIEVRAQTNEAIPIDLQLVCIEGFAFYSYKTAYGYPGVTNVLSEDGKPKKCGE